MAAVYGVVDATISVRLDEPSARDAASCGAKAASLAVACGAGLPVVPGFVVTTAAYRRYLDAERAVSEDVAAALRPAWTALSTDGTVPLVVRSSSTIEDVAASSMAGRFRSVLDVRGWTAFLDALASVFASADEVGESAGPSPIAALVQPFVVPRCGGVLFGVDPVSGDAGRLVVEAVAGGPDSLVSGRSGAQHYEASQRGRVLTIDHRPYHRLSMRHNGVRLLSDRDMRALARLAARAGRVFGGPQDIEWAFDSRASLLLLQSRPVTAIGTAASASGPVLGPGPVAETFPDPLNPLEIDMWVTPLRGATIAALGETRAVARCRLDSSPVITTVHGRVAADLELFGYARTRRPWDLLDPRPSLRRLAASWHVGQTRAVLPTRTDALVREVDGRLAGIALDGRTDEQLLELIEEGVSLLARLHHAEMLAATLLPPAERTAAAMALEVLAQHADDQVSDELLIRRNPVLLSLAPPAVGVPVSIPPAAVRLHSRGPVSVRSLEPREALRLRARWVQELMARAAWSVGLRLQARGLLNDASTVTLLDRQALRALVVDGRQVVDLRDRHADVLATAFTAPLPPQFRLTERGEVVPAARVGARPGTGMGAGGGRATGPAAHGSVRNPPAPGEVLVVRDLQPALAPWLPGLAGLVSETGGTLSHLAILAREFGVPTVVGVHDALRRFPSGVRLVVDGSTGEVDRLDEERSP
jgi:rifampicin phosphotransferase